MSNSSVPEFIFLLPVAAADDERAAAVTVSIIGAFCCLYSVKAFQSCTQSMFSTQEVAVIVDGKSVCVSAALLFVIVIPAPLSTVIVTQLRLSGLAISSQPLALVYRICNHTRALCQRHCHLRTKLDPRMM
jgi:hypothetical protein